jgi:hypothetical protein
MACAAVRWRARAGWLLLTADAGCRLVQGRLHSAAVRPDEVLPMLAGGVVPGPGRLGGIADRQAV